MKNDGATKFVKMLFAGCPQYRAGKDQRDDAIALYVDKLSKWRLTAKVWDDALDRIMKENNGELPELRNVYTYLKQVQATTSTGSGGWQLFTIKGVRYTRPVSDLSNPPALPIGATDGMLAIPREQQAHYEQCPQQEARGAFLAGWLESGGNGDQCVSYFDMVK